MVIWDQVQSTYTVPNQEINGMNTFWCSPNQRYEHLLAFPKSTVWTPSGVPRVSVPRHSLSCKATGGYRDTPLQFMVRSNWQNLYTPSCNIWFGNPTPILSWLETSPTSGWAARGIQNVECKTQIRLYKFQLYRLVYSQRKHGSAQLLRCCGFSETSMTLWVFRWHIPTGMAKCSQWS